MLRFRFVFYMMIIFGIPSVVLADLKIVSSVKSIKQDVSALRKKGVRSKDIVVVWDFHGVVTSEAMHKDSLSLNPDVLKVLKYLKKRKVSQIIATAWDDFSVVQKAVVSLGLDSYFDVDLRETPLQDIRLEGKRRVALKGHKNGRVVALKQSDDPGKYFRRKGYAPEVCFPERAFQCVLFIDDTLGNVQGFKQDFKKTIHYDPENRKKLKLYHLQSPRKDQEVQVRRSRARSSSGSGEYNTFL